MAYATIPAAKQWASDVEAAAGTEIKELPDRHHILWIMYLLEEYALAKQKGSGWKATLAVYLFHATYYWLKKANTKPKTGPDTGKARFVGSGIVTPMTDLKVICAAKAAKGFLMVAPPQTGTQDYDIKLLKAITEEFGKVNTAAEADTALLSKKDSNLVYLKQDAERMRYKVRFRGGIFFRCAELVETAQVEWVPYDSIKSKESERGDGMVHFAMDYRARLYLGFRPRDTDVNFVHASLVGGEPVLCAGKMKVVDGMLLEVNDDSGHYIPQAKQMALMLNQLQVHGVNLEKVMVSNQRSGARIPAFQMIQDRKWPG
jgi:hypothetical protein